MLTQKKRTFRREYYWAKWWREPLRNHAHLFNENYTSFTFPFPAHSKESNTLIASGCGFIEAHLRDRCWQDLLGYAPSATPRSAY